MSSKAGKPDWHNFMCYCSLSALLDLCGFTKHSCIIISRRWGDDTLHNEFDSGCVDQTAHRHWEMAVLRSVMQSERWNKRQGAAWCCGCWQSSVLHLQGAHDHTQLSTSQGTPHHTTAQHTWHITLQLRNYMKHRFNSRWFQSAIQPCMCADARNILI